MQETKNIYVTPEFDIFYFQEEDVITASWDSKNNELIEGDINWG